MAEDVARPPVTPPQPADADYGNEGPATLMVNNRIFELEYQVDDVGPSGISAVDLFVTEDNGKQWFRYGNDSDRRSPFSVDTMAEGTFGFAVRVRNGVGVADIPPQPGTEPEIIVTVDQTAPAIEMAQPIVRTAGAGSVSFAWRIRETHPAQNSVRLEYAAAATGPWTQPLTGNRTAMVTKWPCDPECRRPSSSDSQLVTRPAIRQSLKHHNPS